MLGVQGNTLKREQRTQSFRVRSTVPHAGRNLGALDTSQSRLKPGLRTSCPQLDCPATASQGKPTRMTPSIMSETSSRSSSQGLPWGWWAAWFLVFVSASVIPYLHWRYSVAEIIEPLRHPWGLLPAHWLAFRWCGEVATYALLFVLFAGLWAWLRPNGGRTIILLSALVALVSTLASASLSAQLIITFIREEAHRTPEERMRLNMGLGPTPSNEKPANNK